MRLPPMPMDVPAAEEDVNQVVLHGQSYRQLPQHEIAELHYICSMFSFIPALTNSNCTLLGLVNADNLFGEP